MTRLNMRGYSDKIIDNNLLEVKNDHKRTSLCLVSTQKICLWDMASYRKSAVAKGNHHSIYYKRPFYMCDILKRNS